MRALWDAFFMFLGTAYFAQMLSKHEFGWATLFGACAVLNAICLGMRGGSAEDAPKAP